MFKYLLLLLLVSISFRAVSQVNDIVERELSLIKQVPQYRDRYHKSSITIKPDKQYKTILKLDTLALPYLIDKITDTTETDIVDICSQKKLRQGDVALCLVNDIGLAPPHLVFGGEWDLLMVCGPRMQAGELEYVNQNRLMARDQFIQFF